MTSSLNTPGLEELLQLKRELSLLATGLAGMRTIGSKRLTGGHNMFFLHHYKKKIHFFQKGVVVLLLAARGWIARIGEYWYVSSEFFQFLSRSS